MDRSPEEIVLDPDLIRRLIVGIGEVSEITGVPQRKLRYWQEKGIIDTVRDKEGGTRRFDYLNVKKVVLIQELLEEGYTLDAATEKVESRMERLSEAFEKLAANAEVDRSTSDGSDN
jgi:DNA-binding transcriptional MerR regulator